MEPVPVGIAIPPPELKKYVDKTADFVAEKGQVYEQKISESQKNNPIFAFLIPTNIYHTYYQWRSKTFHTLKQPETAAPATDQVEVISKEQKTKEQTSTSIPSLVKLNLDDVPEMMKDPSLQPQPASFISSPPQISAAQLDIIKLTAVFVARNGRDFHSSLLARENKDEQFHFLKAGHYLNPFFNHLVESYTKVLLPSKQFLNDLQETVAQDAHDANQKILKKAYVRMETEKKKKKEEDEKSGKDEDKDRIQSQMIDWKDFVVVETIVFDDLKKKSEEGEAEPSTLSVPSSAPEIEDADMEMDEEEMEMDDGQGEVEGQDTEINLVKDHVPVYLRKAKKTGKTQLCQICNQEIPVEDMEEHIRIELFNARAREKEKERKANAKDGPMSYEGEIASVLKGLAQRRTDLFGEEELEIGQAVGENEKLVQLQKEVEKVAWDGHSGSVRVATTGGAAMDVHQQIAQLNKQEQARRDALQTPGAQLPGSTPPANPNRPAGILPYPPPPSSAPPVAPPSSAPPVSSAPPASAPPSSSSAPTSTPTPSPSPALQKPPMQPGMVPGMIFPGARPGMMPFPGMMAAPPPPSHPPPPPSTQEPPAKKAKTSAGPPESQLETESAWLQKHPDPVTLRVFCPVGKEEWNMKGQTLEVPSISLKMTVGELKKNLKENFVGIPPNKQKLRAERVGFLRDNQSLASYNISGEMTLELGVKERGGKKN